jgi:hypothetical protein
MLIGTEGEGAMSGRKVADRVGAIFAVCLAALWLGALSLAIPGSLTPGAKVRIFAGRADPLPTKYMILDCRPPSQTNRVFGGPTLRVARYGCARTAKGPAN